MKYFLIITLAVSTLTIGINSAAQALTLGEKQELQTWEKRLAEGHSLKNFEKSCGYALPVKMNENLVTPFMEKKKVAYNYCDAVVAQLAYMCNEELYKQAISTNIKSLSCEYAPEENAGFSISEETGILTFKTHPGHGNIDKELNEYLDNNL